MRNYVSDPRKQEIFLTPWKQFIAYSSTVRCKNWPVAAIIAVNSINPIKNEGGLTDKPERAGVKENEK